MRNKRFILPLILVAVTAVFYLPTINDHFLSDDYDHIMFAQSVDDFNSFVKLLQIPGGTYRPVMNASMTIDYLIWGAQPIGFHLTNIVLFMATVLLIYAAVKMIARQELMAFFAALLFALWPSHHESVTWIAGRTDVLATFFYMLAVCLFIRFARSKKYGWLVGTFIVSVLCFFSKEIGVTLPFVLVGLFIFCLRRQSPLSVRKTIFLVWLPYIVLLAGYLIIRKSIVGGWVGGYTLFGQVSTDALFAAAIKFIFMPYYLIKYLVNFDWLAQFNGIWGNAALINGLALAGVALGVVLAVWLNRKSLKSWAFFMTTVALLVTIYFVTIPGVSIIPSLKTNLMNTRVLYLSTVPLVVLIAYVLSRHPEENKKIKIGSAAVLVCLFAILFVVNYMPWREASQTAGAMLADITSRYPEFRDISYKTHDTEILFANIPDNVHGAFLFRNGWGESLQIAFGNKNLFTSPGRKLVWVVQDKKNPVATTCNFNGKNKQTTKILALRWDDQAKQFIKQQQFVDQYGQRSDLQKQYASQVAGVNTQAWTGMEYASVTRGQVDALTSPILNVPPLSLTSFSFTMESQKDTVADFTWRGQADTVFPQNNTILLPIKAGKHAYVIHLDQCPAWFLHETIEQLRLVPSENAQAITISDIVLK